jgi:hypothetical protein
LAATAEDKKLMPLVTSSACHSPLRRMGFSPKGATKAAMEDFRAGR